MAASYRLQRDKPTSQEPTTAVPGVAAKRRSERLVSLDAYRGFNHDCPGGSRIRLQSFRPAAGHRSSLEQCRL